MSEKAEKKNRRNQPHGERLAAAAKKDGDGADNPGQPIPPEFERILQYLKQARGFDFTNYKPAGLLRRFEKRMSMLGISDFGSYQDYLEVHPDEFAHLFNTILINVTAFFRDPAAWDYLATKIIPDILSRKAADEPVRVWSAGCASGEEAYTLAMLLAEQMGIEALCERTKIYATDVDEDALNTARLATYGPREIEGVPEPLREKYFEQVNDRYIFRKELRRCVIFGRHDLFEDAPISRVDLLTCRNALMYFNAEAQGRILNRFQFALNDGGYLFLGKAEMLLTRGELFKPVDLRHRVFTKTARGRNTRDRLLNLAQNGAGVGNGETEEAQTNHARLRQVAFDSRPLAQIVVDTTGVITGISEHARMLFALPQRFVGRLLQDLEMSYKPVELRSLIDTALRENHAVALKEIDFSVPRGERVFFDLTVTPLPSPDGVLGARISFTDVTRHKRLNEELARSHLELEASQEELQSTTEELETTNEELQSTIEELETTNEELQSTNEELETMNEELQSTNEELHTINEELRQRSAELHQTNGFLEAILGSLQMAVIVLDGELRVTAWNERAYDLWGLRGDEVRGQHFLNLDIGLPAEQVKQHIRNCAVNGGESLEVVVDAHNRRGREIHCKLVCSSLKTDRKDAKGVILLMEETEKAPPQELDERS